MFDDADADDGPPPVPLTPQKAPAKAFIPANLAGQVAP